MDQAIKALYDLTTAGQLPEWKFREMLFSLVEKEVSDCDRAVQELFRI